MFDGTGGLSRHGLVPQIAMNPPNLFAAAVVSPDVDMSLKAGQPVAIGFPASGPVLITG
jgi:hypothetical protein